MNRRVSLVASLGIVAVGANATFADQRLHQPGVACLPADYLDNIDRSNTGLVNNQTSGARDVFCPLQFSSSTLGPQDVDPGEARVDYFTTGSDDNTWLSCTPRLLKASTISTVSLGTRHSCTTAGGCTSIGALTSGVNYLSWSDSVGTTSDISAAFIECNLSKLNDGEYMTIRSYSLRLVSP